MGQASALTTNRLISGSGLKDMSPKNSGCVLFLVLNGQHYAL
jgi:hypothetical protein